MAAPLPAGNLANLLSLPARHFAVIDAGSQRTRILVASVARGRPRFVRALVLDPFEDGTVSPEELREDVRQRLREIAPEALILVAPPQQVLRHVLDTPPADSAHTRSVVEREASSIGGLSESPWAFDSARLRPFGRLAHPLGAAFLRQDHLDALLDAWTDDPHLVFDIRTAGDALATAFLASPAPDRNAVLVDLGARHTGITVLVDSQPVYSTSFPVGSDAFTTALSADRGCPAETAEALKRADPPAVNAKETPALHAALLAWLHDLERTLQEWRDDHPDLSAAAAGWRVILAGGGALQPGLPSALSRLGTRPFDAFPTLRFPAGNGTLPPTADFAVCWGALLLALGTHPGVAAPTFLPAPIRQHWARQRLWRGLLMLNLAFAGVLALLLFLTASRQEALLARKRAWKAEATQALGHARDIRIVSEGFNTRMEALRPVLEQQRQTVETLQVLGVLQRQRTNAQHWYVLLADALSYASGTNTFAPPAPPRPPEARLTVAPTLTPTNPPPSLARAFIAEVCLIPQGESMRQTLGELVGELKRFTLFRNVDVLPAERRRSLVDTNLIFAERHFALELNLSEAELLPPIPLPPAAQTNREPPRTTFRSAAPRPDTSITTNAPRPGRP